MDEPSLNIQQELASLVKRVEKLEHRLEFVTQHAPRVRGFTGEPIKLLQHLECVAEALKDIDWPAHSAATTAPLPRLDRDAVAAGWRKIRDERESATAAGLSPMEPAPQAPQGVTVEELACILSVGPAGSDLGEAYWLLKHPRIGPLLRGEGAPVQSPVVLPEKQPQAQAAHPIQPLIVNEHGTLRFKENPIVRHLLDTHPSCGLNELACMKFSDEDQQQFAQLIGYSLSGYGTLSYVSDESYDAAASTVHARQQGGQADG